MTLEDEIIDYKLLVDAINLYTKIGYSQIEVPWIVSSSVSMETCPSIKYVYHADLVNEHFVGSAEQGFIQLIKNTDTVVVDKKENYCRMIINWFHTKLIKLNN